MKRLICLCFLFVLASTLKSQECEPLRSDTMSLPLTDTVLQGQFQETTLRNQSVVRIFKTENERLFIRLIVTKNFYFGKVAMLEIQSGTKSYYIKNCIQHKVDKGHGMYIAEVYRNYLATLKEYGITGIVFGEAETDFTRADAAQIREIAACVYATLPPNR